MELLSNLILSEILKCRYCFHLIAINREMLAQIGCDEIGTRCT